MSRIVITKVENPKVRPLNVIFKTRGLIPKLIKTYEWYILLELDELHKPMKVVTLECLELGKRILYI